MGITNSKFYTTLGIGATITTGVLYMLFSGSNTKFTGTKKTKAVMGLSNIGATCYLNAVLQALSSCTHFSQWLAHKDDANRADFPPRIPTSYAGWQYPMIAVVYRAILVINRELEKDDDKNMSKVPGDVIKTLRSRGYRFQTAVEQDTFEFLQFLLQDVLAREVESSIRRQQKGSIDCLLDEEDTSEVSGELISVSEVDSLSLDHQGPSTSSGFVQPPIVTPLPPPDVITNSQWSLAWDPMRSVNRTFSRRKINVDGSHRAAPRSPFQGMTLTKLQCAYCFHNSPLRLEPFTSISLAMPFGANLGSLSVVGLLGEFLRPTMVTNVDCIGCSKKSGKPTKSVFSKQTFLLRLPLTLCLHVSRVSWCGSAAKNSQFVRFPECLNLSDLKRFHETSNQRELEQEAGDTVTMAKSQENRLRRFRDGQYILVAVVSHAGDTERGHFVTFRRGPSPQRTRGSEEWFFTSDATVERVSINEVLLTRAYLLFYEKVHTTET